MPKSDGKRGRLKDALVNTALVVVSILATYAICEVIFFRFILPDLPLAYRIYLPDRADFFLQVSKSRYVPQDYIALVGDSYAQGMGDWLMSQGLKGSQPYHSADVIHQSLGRDVASLGRAAAGSAEAMVLRVTRIYDDGYCYLFPALDLPKRFLIYFYEGNDLDDNYKLVQHRIRAGASELPAKIDAFLDDDYAKMSGWRCHGHLGDTIWKMLRFHVRHGLSPDVTYNVGPVPPVNRILVDGTGANARELNVPSLALDDKQIDQAVIVYDRALAWFRKRFPQVPTTVVYLPAPATMYRYETPKVVSGEIYDPAEQQKPGRPHLSSGRSFAPEAVYAGSRKICEKIRAVSLARGAGFIDTRRAFRAGAAKAPMHGPRDWNHLNEAGYRLLGKLVADRMDVTAADACDERWEAEVAGTTRSR